MKKEEIQRIIEREIMCSDLDIDISHQRQAQEFTQSLTEAIHQALSMYGVSKSVCCNSTVLDWQSIDKKFCSKCGDELK
jgi:hypothetical protein